MVKVPLFEERLLLTRSHVVVEHACRQRGCSSCKKPRPLRSTSWCWLYWRHKAAKAHCCAAMMILAPLAVILTLWPQSEGSRLLMPPRAEIRITGSKEAQSGKAGWTVAS